MVAKFGALDEDSRIILYPDYAGPMSIRLDTSSLDPKSVGCDTFEIGIFDRPKFSFVILSFIKLKVFYFFCEKIFFQLTDIMSLIIPQNVL